MPLHLVFPGLLWPQKALRDTAYDLELPALGRLLGRGSKRWQPPLSLESWLCREFGIATEEPPVAALRLLGEGGQPGRDFWLCADPAHLGIGQGRQTLSVLDIDRETMEQVAASLAPIFQALLPSFADSFSGRHHYLRLAAHPELLTTAPSTVIGRAVPSEHLSGPDARAWLRLDNEVQMHLHALPLNREREAQGLPTINTLWFWGAGSLPETISAPYQAIFADHPLLRGLASLAAIPCQGELPESHALPGGGMNLLLVDAMQSPAQELDAAAWREAVSQSESDWLKPLQAALQGGRIERLRITALGEEACLDVHLKRSDLFKFWRRPVPLHELAKP